MPDEGGRVVFVHSSVLFRSSMTDLLPGQGVLLHAESVPRGLQATRFEPLLTERPPYRTAATENERDAP